MQAAVGVENLKIFNKILMQSLFWDVKFCREVAEFVRHINKSGVKTARVRCRGFLHVRKVVDMRTRIITIKHVGGNEFA